jgi:putative phosphoribosyl transferase
MMFTNREEAADRLVTELKKFKLKNPLILAIPRGAGKMAEILADRLNGDLDVVLVHKFCPVWQPELAIGAVAEGGQVMLNQVAKHLGLSEMDIERSIEVQTRKLQARRKLYTPYRSPVDPKGRTVVIVDDGIATGATMIAAINVMKKKGASRIIVAAPVASQEAAVLVDKENVETCFLDTPEAFFAVGQFYRDFPQVTDDEVVTILTRSHRGKAAVPEKDKGSIHP